MHLGEGCAEYDLYRLSLRLSVGTTEECEGAYEAV